MAETLKPCPFCGGEAEMFAGEYRDGGCVANYAYVRCKRCGTRTYEFREHMTSDEVMGYAAEVWNERAERTCRVVTKERRFSKTQTLVTKSCSACGHAFGSEEVRPILPGLDETMVLESVDVPSYCPHCGARVVEEGA